MSSQQRYGSKWTSSLAFVMLLTQVSKAVQRTMDVILLKVISQLRVPLLTASSSIATATFGTTWAPTRCFVRTGSFVNSPSCKDLSRKVFIRILS